MYQGEDRRKNHECIKEEEIGMFKEFMENTKGLKATLFVIALTMLASVGSAIWWGSGISTTVTSHEKSIDKILSKLDNIKIVYAQGDNGQPIKEGN